MQTLFSVTLTVPALDLALVAECRSVTGREWKWPLLLGARSIPQRVCQYVIVFCSGDQVITSPVCVQ
jgi:hypothetical protein